MADEHEGGEKKQGKKPEYKSNLTEGQNKKLENLKKTVGVDTLIIDLYDKTLTNYNNSTEAFAKKDPNHAIGLAPLIGQLKGYYKQAKSGLGSLRYYLSDRQDAKLLREVGYHLKRMESKVKGILDLYTKQAKEVRKEALGSMKAYIPASK